jgi:hypothetical protein
LVEKLLLDHNEKIPFDYKLHCFNGDVKFIQVDIDRFTDHRRNFYDINWDLLPFVWCTVIDGQPLWPNGREVCQPKSLSEMLGVAKKLSANFLYVRVDLYELEGKVFFGELTFHPGNGAEMFLPNEWDKRFGGLIKI